MTSSAFSSADAAVLEREADPLNEQIELKDIWSEKQQTDCFHWIKRNQFTKVCKQKLLFGLKQFAFPIFQVCLQFPDSYLPFSTNILDSLTSQCEKIKAFVLADTSYGSCCVDEVCSNIQPS